MSFENTHIRAHIHANRSSLENEKCKKKILFSKAKLTPKKCQISM